MWMMKSLALATIVVLLIVVLWGHLGEPQRFFSGFWRGNQGFLDESGLVDMYLKIEDAEPTWFGRPSYDAYLLMSTAEGIICNQGVTIRPSLGSGITRRDLYEGPATLEFEDSDTSPWPKEVTLALSQGSLAIHDGNELLALFVREHLDADC
jgi:hypothetical protein